MKNSSRIRPAKSRAAAPPAPVAPKLRVGFVLAHRFTLTAFAGFVDALRLAADEGDRSRPLQCQWSVLGNPASPVVSSCGATVQPWDEMECPERFDYIVVVGGLLHGGQTVPAGTNAFLRAAAHANVPLVGLCTGSFVLARAGLLDGYVACVSWFHREDFEREFPALNVVSDRMFVVDRDRISCAGGTSVVHLAAHLIERHCGRAHAAKSLRILIEDQPLGAEAPQPESIVTRQAADTVVRQAMLMIEQRLAHPDLLVDISRELGISMRQLERRFVADVSITPRHYRLQLRLARARWMIEHTDASLTDIGFECGFGNCSHFSRAFANHFKAPPSSLRRTARIA
ncbi:MAG: GlxA family transcriptional regulator [Betaproteobacteria bacterium]